MAEDRTERRLAAILAADVVGYTRLMGADETGTLRHLTELRQQVLEPLIAEHHGRVVKLIGDGLLVEFASVVDAVIRLRYPRPLNSIHNQNDPVESRWSRRQRR